MTSTRLSRIGPAPTGIILAGAHPWTNSQFDTLMPRQLVPVAHRPLISYALSWLERAGIESVAICGNRGAGLQHDRLEQQVGPAMRLNYLEDPMPRGSAGCVRDAVAADEGDTFIVTDGTSIPNVDLDALLTFHRASGAAATVVVHPERGTEGPSELRPPTGVFVFERRALESVPARGFYDIKEHLIPRLHKAGDRVIVYSSERSAPRVLGASTYLAVNEWVLDRLVAPGHSPQDHNESEPAPAGWDAPAGYVRMGDGLVHRDASVHPDVVITGPVLIAAGAHVHAGAVLVGPSSIGRNSTVEEGALVSRSAVWRRSVIGARATADRSIVADSAVMERESRAFRTVVLGRHGARRHS